MTPIYSARLLTALWADEALALKRHQRLSKETGALQSDSNRRLPRTFACQTGSRAEYEGGRVQWALLSLYIILEYIHDLQEKNVPRVGRKLFH